MGVLIMIGASCLLGYFTQQLVAWNGACEQQPTPRMHVILSVCGWLFILSVIQPQWMNGMEYIRLMALFWAVVNSIHDWQTEFVYDYVNYAFIVSAGLYYGFVHGWSPTMLVMGVLCVGFFCLSECVETGIGSGDSLFFLGCWLLVGWIQFTDLLIVTALSGTIYSGYLWLNGRLEWQTRIPLTPFLLLATLLIE